MTDICTHYDCTNVTERNRRYIVVHSGSEALFCSLKCLALFYQNEAKNTMIFYQGEGRVTMEHDSAGWTCYIDDDALQFGPDNYEEVLRAYQGRKVRITLELIK